MPVNPYIVDRPLTEEDLFRGRAEAFARLIDELRRGQRLVLLYGRPRIGKTSFLNQLPSRLSEQYSVRRVEWQMLTLHGNSPLYRIESGVSQAMGATSSVGSALGATAGHLAHEGGHASGSMPAASESDDTTYLVCFDGIMASDLTSHSEWDDALSRLGTRMSREPYLAILLVIDGSPDEHGPALEIADLPHIVLGPLAEEETEDLLTLTSRGRLVFDYDAMQRVHHLSGGEPFLVQLYGSVLFEHRAAAGWVGLPEVDKATDEVIARGAALIEGIWANADPAARIVLCAFAERIGQHGIGTVEDVARYLRGLRVQVPVGDIERALTQLSSREIFQKLGGNTYRFRNVLFQRWLHEHKNTLETVRETRRYRRARLRPISWREKPVDWTGMLLWGVAGLLVLLIVYVWQSRNTQVLWLGAPTPPPYDKAVLPATATPIPPTPERGVAPGHIVYMLKQDPDATWEIYSMRSDGSDPVRLTDNDANDMSPSWSPDGRQILFVSDRDGNRDVFVMNADGNGQINVTNHPTEDWTPVWSPDGDRIAFGSLRSGNWEIYTMDTDGGDVQRLTTHTSADYGPAWSPDGEQIAFVSNRDGNLEVYVMALADDAPVRVTNDEATDQSPAWSPDGTRLLWESYRDGNMEIYSANADGTDLRNLSQDAFADDHNAAWSPWGGRIVFFSNRDRGWDIFSLDLDTGERANLTVSPAFEQAPHWGR